MSRPLRLNCSLFRIETYWYWDIDNQTITMLPIDKIGDLRTGFLRLLLVKRCKPTLLVLIACPVVQCSKLQYYVMKLGKYVGTYYHFCTIHCKLCFGGVNCFSCCLFLLVFSVQTIDDNVVWVMTSETARVREILCCRRQTQCVRATKFTWCESALS